MFDRETDRPLGLTRSSRIILAYELGINEDGIQETVFARGLEVSRFRDGGRTGSTLPPRPRHLTSETSQTGQNRILSSFRLRFFRSHRLIFGARHERRSRVTATVQDKRGRLSYPRSGSPVFSQDPCRQATILRGTRRGAEAAREPRYRLAEAGGGPHKSRWHRRVPSDAGRRPPG